MGSRGQRSKQPKQPKPEPTAFELLKQGKPVYIAEWFANKNDIEDNKIYGFKQETEKAIQVVANSTSIDFGSGTTRLVAGGGYRYQWVPESVLQAEKQYKEARKESERRTGLWKAKKAEAVEFAKQHKLGVHKGWSYDAIKRRIQDAGLDFDFEVRY